MTHLPYIVASYGLSACVIVFFGVSSTSRLVRARRRLASAEAARVGPGARR